MRATEEDFELDEWTRDEMKVIVLAAGLSVTVFVGMMLYVALWLR